MSVAAGVALFAISFIVAAVACPLAARLGTAVGLVDRPRPGEVQRRPIARTGGYGVVVAFLAGVGASTLLVGRDDAEWTRLAGLLAGAVPLLILAVLDDVYRLKPGPQAIGQVVAASVAMGFGLVIHSVANPWGTLTYLPLWVALPFTMFWIFGMVNTVNFLDTMDGVAGGVAAIAATFLFIRSVDLGQASVATLPLALMGACLGFLMYNFNPARLIMGSSGSLFLGYCLAIMAIFGGAKIATAAMVMGIPILDVLLVIVIRRARGRSPFQGGDSALLTQRLHRLGWSQRRVALTMYGLAIGAGLLALSLSRVQKAYLFALVLVGCVLGAAFIVRQLRRLDSSDEGAALGAPAGGQPSPRG